MSTPRRQATAAALFFPADNPSIPQPVAGTRCVLRLVALLLLGLPAMVGGASDQVRTGIGYRTIKSFQPKYEIRPDRSVELRICFNWSCARTDTLTFSARDMAQVIEQMGLCPATTKALHDRLQRLRIGIWQMQLLAQKYQPLLANDRAGNEEDREVEGRTDCVDNASNTTTYLRILQDLAALPGWSVAAPRTRNPLPLDEVHWTAVVKDRNDGRQWSVDSWYRPHGHLPFVMPLADWLDEQKAWEPPFDKLNPYPRFIDDLCDAPSHAGVSHDSRAPAF